MLRYQNLAYNNKLCKLFSIRDVTAIRALGAAQSQNHYLNMLTASVTHELMTPINCISTFSSSLALSLKKGPLHY